MNLSLYCETCGFRTPLTSLESREDCPRCPSPRRLRLTPDSLQQIMHLLSCHVLTELDFALEDLYPSLGRAPASSYLSIENTLTGGWSLTLETLDSGLQLFDWEFFLPAGVRRDLQAARRAKEKAYRDLQAHTNRRVTAGSVVLSAERLKHARPEDLVAEVMDAARAAAERSEAYKRQTDELTEKLEAAEAAIRKILSESRRIP